MSTAIERVEALVDGWIGSDATKDLLAWIKDEQ